jgi:translation initiation factor IF-3
MNEEITAEKVRLVTKDPQTGKSLSTIVRREEALREAKLQKLDLVLGK